jgi:hypothetical protein
MLILLNAASPDSLSGKRVCVAGRLGLTEGLPSLTLTDASAIQVLD